MYDARAVANTVISACERQGISLTNLKLQKLLYFVHGRFLIEQGQPLLNGEFEAWQYGPVHPLVYAAFKDFGSAEITSRAFALDPVLRTKKTIGDISDVAVVRHVEAVVSSLGGLSPGQLVNLTHVKDGPWDRTVKDAESSANLGLKIRNTVIQRHFSTLKLVSVGGEERNSVGDVRENAPYS